MDIGKVNLTQYPETGRGLTIEEELDLFKLQLASEKMYNALKVLLTSPKLLALLQTNDNQAYSQARQAVELYEQGGFKD